MQKYHAKMIPILCFFLSLTLLISGCNRSSGLRILYCGSNMNTAQIPNSPVLSSDKYMPSHCYIVMGSGETQDAKLQDAIGQSQFAAMVTGQEIDIILCTLDKDDMFAKSDSFMPLEKIFSAEELTELADRMIAYETDSTPYGVILTDTEAFTAVFGDAPIGIFLADNCPNPSLAKELMRNLVLE